MPRYLFQDQPIAFVTGTLSQVSKFSLSLLAFRVNKTKPKFHVYTKPSTSKKTQSSSVLSESKIQKERFLSVIDFNLSQKFHYSSLTDSHFYVNTLLTSCEERLRKKQIDEALLNAEYIVAHALGIFRGELLKVMNKPIKSEELSNIEDMMLCRLARMPLQYILGNWDFHSIKLKVRPPIFIPRRETEGLVNLCINALRRIEQPLTMDIGCGSGAISLVLLNHFPQLVCVAVDQSKYATELTLENAHDLNLSDRLHVIRGKISDAAFPPLLFPKFDLIVSNPPYVLRKDLIKMQAEITLYEDLRALDGGVEGLDVIKLIILHGYHHLKHGGCLLMEIDPCHRYLLPAWMEENNLAYNTCKFFKDYREADRYVKLTKNHENKNKKAKFDYD